MHAEWHAFSKTTIYKYYLVVTGTITLLFIN
jgi:hypothetical protein